MNYGKVLRQADPELILKEYQSPTLENVFLILCQSEQLNSKQANHIMDLKDYQNDSDGNGQVENKQETCEKGDFSTFKRLQRFFTIDWKRVKAMNTKFYLTTTGRHLYLFVFFTIIPMVILMNKFAMGKKPADNPIALYNADSGSHLSHSLWTL